ncbi:unnamed protein product [Paramecium sonneborni]|uniref:Uncharacterized protein n=1 Tax=Paramecium sonneborni TaxID=65129 RepID=A0A8S1MJ22_9CILI|nr:unnamed protein product [Paramecium sonneborni]
MNKLGKRFQIDQQIQSPRKFQNLQNDNLEIQNQLVQQHIFDNSMSMNIKEHIDKLSNTLKSIKEDLRISREDMNLIKEDLQKIKSNQYQEEDRITKTLLSDLNKQKNDLKKQQITTSITYTSLNKQISLLEDDKIYIKDNIIQLESDTSSLEIQIGFRTNYDI